MEGSMLSRIMFAGVLALAVTGCATGTRSAALDPRVGGDGVGYTMTEAMQQCEQGPGAAAWYDRAAGVCDSVGD
jgi:hypothetical protein